MANLIARALVEGDNHFSSKQYGGHNNYPAECLYYSNRITDKLKELGCTHYFGTGDFSYGRFHTLEFRERIEKMFRERHEILGNNIWYLKGNHDSASYGTTEYEYYLGRKEFRGAETLDIGNVRIHMKDYGRENEQLDIAAGKVNILLTHGFFRFSDSQLPNYGTAVMLDEHKPWFGVDYIISGHIHNEYVLQGLMMKDGMGKQVVLHYLPCLSRPAYLRAGMPEEGHVAILEVYDDGKVNYLVETIPYLPLEQSFNMAVIEAKDTKKELTHIDVADIAKKMSEHSVDYGDPATIIMAKENIDERYRLKAVELLRQAMA